MTEDSEEEQIEEPTSTHSENNSSEIQSKQNSDEINSNQEIEKMEVHHHAHHQGKKNWKSYFWEFLMLFLAVTLGFFVENQREHYIENLRAKEYSKSLIKDLHNDIIAIQRQTKIATMFIALSDSLINLSPAQLEGRASAQFSFYTRFMYWTGSIIWNRATFEQIKNSGSLRYFKNQQLLEKLMKYDGIINEIEMEAYNHQVRGNLLVNHINQILEPAYHQKLSKYFLFSYDSISKNTMESLFPAHPESLENKRSEIREMLNMVVIQQRNLQRDIDDEWPQAEKMANELINDFKNEYQIQ
jgi:hypothetical protein